MAEPLRLWRRTHRAADVGIGSMVMNTAVMTRTKPVSDAPVEWWRVDRALPLGRRIFCLVPPGPRMEQSGYQPCPAPLARRPILVTKGT